MRTRTPLPVAISITFLFISFHAAGGSVFPAPEPVSPGGVETVRLTADRCPTFSWSGLPGAWGYEIAIFSVTPPMPESVVDASSPAVDIDPHTAVPLVRTTVPAGSASWTPSVEECLAPGREYVWFIREAAGPGRQAGAWSEAANFGVSESIAWEDQQRELGDLIDRLEVLASGFGEVPGEPTLQPEWVIDDVYNYVTWALDRTDVGSPAWYIYQARNYAKNIFEWKDGVGDLEDVKNSAVDLLALISEGRDFLDAPPSSSATGNFGNEALGDGSVRAAIREARDILKFTLENAFEGKAEFVSGGCDPGSECGDFKKRFTDLLNAVETLVSLPSELGQTAITSGVASPELAVMELRHPEFGPELAFSRFRSLIERLPAPVIYPLYRVDQELGLTSELGDLSQAITDIEELAPLLSNQLSSTSSDIQLEAIGPCSWLEQDLESRERFATIVGYRLKIHALAFKVLGNLIEAGSTTSIKPKAGIHGYAGATIETDVPETVTNLVEGTENVLSFASDKILSTVSDCGAAREQQARDEQMQAIQDGLPSPDLLTELENLSSVPSDVELVKSEVGGVKDEVGLVRTDVGGVKDEVGLVRTDVGGVKDEVGLVRTDVGGVKDEVGLVRTDVGGVKDEVGLVRTDVGGVKDEVGLVRTDVGSVKDEVGLVRTEVGGVKDEVGLVLTDVGNVKDDVGLVRTEVGGVKDDVGLVRTDVGGVKDDVRQVRTDVDAVRDGVGQVRTDVGAVNDNVALVRTDVGGVRDDVGLVRTDIGSMKQDVGLVRTEVGAVKGELDVVRNDVGGVRQDVGLVRTDIGSMKGDVDLVRTDVGVVNENVGQVRTDVGAMKLDVVSVRSEVAGISDDVGVVKGELGLVKGDVGLVKSSVDETKRATDQLRTDLGDAASAIENASATIEQVRTATRQIQGGVDAANDAIANSARSLDAFSVRSGAEHTALARNLAAQDDELAGLVSSVGSHDQRVANGLDALIARLDAVEADNHALRMARIESHIANCTPTLDLLLPRSQGGEVETVIEIVETSIATASSLGIKTSKAEKDIAKGRASLASGDYAQAFGSFCDAYQSLLK